MSYDSALAERDLLMNESTGSRLFYFGTNEEVRLGDRVLMRRWLFRNIVGTVCYIPGISPLHSELGDDQWAIRGDHGTVWAMGYFPDDKRYGQPRRRLVLLERGSGGEMTPDEPLL
jgi:hypothetical protein